MGFKEVMALIQSKEQAQLIMFTFKDKTNVRVNGYFVGQEFTNALIDSFKEHNINVSFNANTCNAVIERLERKSKIAFID